MATITSAGVGSGLDLESIINATLQAEDQPKLQAFNEKDANLNIELSAIGAVTSSLSAFQDVVEKLADIENFNQRSAVVTQPTSGDLISVSATSDATAGNFSVEVLQLAQGSRAVSADGVYADSTDVVSASGGNLTFGAGAKSFTVAIDPGATLEEVREAINDASDNFGVSVNIINTGGATPSSKLVFTSDETGTGNDLTVTADNAEFDAISTTAFGGGAGGLSIAAGDAAQDAIIEVDGITINSDTNTFKDSIQDITITALKESEAGETAQLKVDVDKESVETLVNEFISAFNNVVGTIDYHTEAGAALNGDSTMRSLSSGLVRTLSSSISGAGGYETIYDIGLGLSKDGTLEKDSLVRSLTDALTENYDDVGVLFAGADGIASQFEGFLDNYLEADGALQFRQDDINADLRKLEKDVANHQYRMEQLEITLREKYSALDVLIAQMQSSSSYLQSQLASLPGFTSGSS
ncbi:MAG: flagellar filament capping protein FliD [Thalassotalea sp.]|nr:flagellar filament capping protein FliD [Thalassotalea sp.]